MWQVDDRDWECLKRVGADCTADQREQLKKIIDKGEIIRDDVDKIFDLLPKDANFYEFAQQLRLKPRSYEGPAPTAEFLALTERLRQEQAQNEYNEMVTSVDSTQNYGNVNLMQDFGKEMKEVNRQVIAIVNTLITVAGAFAFGYYGVSFAYPSLNLNFETRITMGLCLGTVVFFADLYFIAKSMDAPTQQQRKAGEKTYALNTKNVAKAAVAPKSDEVSQQSTKKSTPKQEKKSEPTKKSQKVGSPNQEKKSAPLKESTKVDSPKQEKKTEAKVESPKPTKKIETHVEPEETIIKDVKEPELASDEPAVTQRPKAGRRRVMKID